MQKVPGTWLRMDLVLLLEFFPATVLYFLVEISTWEPPPPHSLLLCSTIRMNVPEQNHRILHVVLCSIWSSDLFCSTISHHFNHNCSCTCIGISCDIPSHLSQFGHLYIHKFHDNNSSTLDQFFGYGSHSTDILFTSGGDGMQKLQ